MASQLFFCLDFFHPGEGGKPAAPDDSSRYFASAEAGCPTCPSCAKQVSAAMVPDDQTLPNSVLQTVARNQRDLTTAP